MAKYKVDKKAFEERLLSEQLTHVELQSKYLKDEPLRRSEVDEYNRLRANGWVKNSLITIGVLSATAIAFIIFILLGNMLMTNGRTGDVDTSNVNSADVYVSFTESEYYPEDWSDGDPETMYVDYSVPSSYLADPYDDVYITYRLTWEPSYNSDGNGKWEVGRLNDSIGTLTQSYDMGRDNEDYSLDAKKTNLNNLMTDWFKGQDDGWAKSLIEDFFYTAWPLTLVLWLVFLSAIAAYAVVLVVGIRYVIRTVIVILRKAGYIASDFVWEVKDAVKSEIPIVEVDDVEDLDLSTIKKQVEEKFKSAKEAEEKEYNEAPSMREQSIETVSKMAGKKLDHLPIEDVETLPDLYDESEDTKFKTDTKKEPEETKKPEKPEKKGKEKMNDIFDL